MTVGLVIGYTLAALSFFGAVYFTAILLEFWANKQSAPRWTIIWMAMFWTAVAGWRGLFFP